MSGDRWRSLVDRAPWIGRRLWLLAASVTLITAIAWLAPTDETYRAEATLVVSPEGVGADIGLARTYVSLIPQDTAIRSHLADELDVDADDVEELLAVTQERDTALLTIHAQASSPELALNAVRAVALALTDDPPITEAIAPESLILVDLDDAAQREEPVVDNLVAVGAVLGVAVGALLVFLWERVDARIDSEDDLHRVAGCATTSSESLTEELIPALVDRWRRLLHGRSGVVALLPGTEHDHEATSQLHARMVVAAGDQRGGVDVATSSDRRDVALAVEQLTRSLVDRWRELMAESETDAAASGAANDADAADEFLARLLEDTGAPDLGAGDGDGDGDGDGIALVVAGSGPAEESTRLAIDADLVVLVTSRGTPVRQVRRRLELLEDFGSSPSWAVLVVDDGRADPDPAPDSSLGPSDHQPSDHDRAKGWRTVHID